MMVPEEREGKSTEASGILARDSGLAKEDAISIRKGGQHEKEKHRQVKSLFASILCNKYSLHDNCINNCKVTLFCCHRREGDPPLKVLDISTCTIQTTVSRS